MLLFNDMKILLLTSIILLLVMTQICLIYFGILIVFF